LIVRRLIREEMADAARVHRAAFDERLPWLAGLHTPAEDLAYFRDVVFADCAVWGAWRGGALAGFVAFRDGWIDHLYVLPDRQSQGAGSALLDVARQDQTAVRLWTFQRNTRARAFYERRGFMVLEETDGARNQEREPDVLYEWRGSVFA
jgi:GNAT superfamily N-acetyltransferase